MAANKHLVNERHEAVRTEFKRLSLLTTKTGKRKYTYAKIVEDIADKFFYSPAYVEKLICA